MDVPTETLIARFPRTLANLNSAIHQLPHVMSFDNDDLRRPFQRMAVVEQGRRVTLKKPAPDWLLSALE